MSAAFETQQLAEDLKPLKVANREAFVFPSYRTRMSEHSDQSAVVTHNGKPIIRGGEQLLLGMVPMERRYAIGPAEMGRAEVLPQHIFAEEHEKAYVEEFKMRGQAPDNPKLRYVPNVVDFVAWKIDPSNPSRITTLGYRPGDPAPVETKQPAVEEVESLRAQKDAQAMQLDEMQRKLDELAALVASGPVKVAEEKTAAAMETAPCGREIRAGFLSQHQRFCKKPGCAPAE